MTGEIFNVGDDGVTIDVGQLNEGDYIEPHSIADAYGVDVNDRRFGFVVMNLRDYIERQSFAQDRPLLVKGEGYGLRVLTADEAVEYLDSKFYENLIRMRRLHEKYKRIPISNFAQEMIARYHDKAAKQSRIVQNVNKTVEKLRLETRIQEVEAMTDGGETPQLPESN